MKVHAYGRHPRLIITENGAGEPDRVSGDTMASQGETAEPRVHDQRRLLCIHEHLAQFDRARRDGAPLDGHFAWSLLDDFEGSDACGPRTGIVCVDFTTQRRMVEGSGRWFLEFLA